MGAPVQNSHKIRHETGVFVLVFHARKRLDSAKCYGSAHILGMGSAEEMHPMVNEFLRVFAELLQLEWVIVIDQPHAADRLRS